MAKQRNVVEWVFLLDQRNMQKGLADSKRGMQGVQSVTRTLTRAMGALGLAIGAREILRFGKDSIDAAADYTEAVNAIMVVNQEGAASIDAFGRGAAESVGLSRTAVLETAVAFQGFLEAIDRDGDTSDTFETLTTRAADFASVMNIDVEDALSVFSSTLAGQSKPIRAFGIDTSAAAVSAFALANGIGEVGKELSGEDKILATYGLIMQETDETAGDFAATSDELANSQRTLGAEFENAKIKLGDQLLPVMKAGVDSASFLLDQTEGLGRGWAKIQKNLLPFADDIKELTHGQIDLAKSYRDTGVDLFFFNQAMDTVIDKLVAGQDVVQVAGDALLDLGTDGAITTKSLASLRVELKLTDEQFLTAAKRALFMAESAGIAGDDIDTLRQEALDLGTVLDKKLVKQEEDAAEGARNLAFQTLQAARAQNDMRKGIPPLSDMLDIFTGDLFSAARAAEHLKRSTGSETVGGLFAGGSGSGQINKASGGIVPGPAGAPVEATVHGGEEIVSLADRKRGAGATVVININALDPNAAAVAVADALRIYQATYGDL